MIYRNDAAAKRLLEATQRAIAAQARVIRAVAELDAAKAARAMTDAEEVSARQAWAEAEDLGELTLVGKGDRS